MEKKARKEGGTGGEVENPAVPTGAQKRERQPQGALSCGVPSENLPWEEGAEVHLLSSARGRCHRGPAPQRSVATSSSCSQNHLWITEGVAKGPRGEVSTQSCHTCVNTARPIGMADT